MEDAARWGGNGELSFFFGGVVAWVKQFDVDARMSVNVVPAAPSTLDPTRPFPRGQPEYHRCHKQRPKVEMFRLRSRYGESVPWW